MGGTGGSGESDRRPVNGPAVAVARSDDEIAQWHRELLRYVHRLTGDPDLSEDFAQEALLRLLSVDPSRPMHNARAWLYRVATNLVRDHARRNDMMRRRPIPIDADAPQTPEQALERNETVARVRAVLDRLTPRDREMLVLRQSGFRHREIADIVNVKPDSVSMLASRAMKRFRTAYLEETPQ